jgi:hypothetical protein
LAMLKLSGRLEAERVRNTVKLGLQYRPLMAVPAELEAGATRPAQGR